MAIRTIAITLAIMAITGCSSYHTEFQELSTDDAGYPSALLVDIKQRAYLIGRPQGNGPVVTCAEPSPDAMSSLAASLSADLGLDTGHSLGLANSFSESVAYTGLRTGPIVLMRDSMYRLCEAYLSGAIDGDEYAHQLRRYQRYMVALLAIDKITGTVQAPTVTLSSKTSAQVARNLIEFTDSLDDLSDEIAALETKKAAIDSENTEEMAAIQAKIERRNALKESLEEALAAGQSGLSNASTTAEIGSFSGTSLVSKVDYTEMVKAVENITKSVLQTNDAPWLCIKALSSDSPSTEVAKYCNHKVFERNDGTILNVPYNLFLSDEQTKNNE